MKPVPDWMTQQEPYTPPAGKDRFLDKSIRGFLSLLSRIRQQGQHEHDLLWVSPFFKLLGVVLWIVLVSASRSFTFVYAMLAFVAVLLALLPGTDIRRILKLAIPIPLLTYLILVPSALTGNRYAITMIPLKVLISLTAVGILSASTRWDHLISALRRLRIPSLLVFTFDIMVKYLIILGEHALTLLYALKLRSVGTNHKKYGSLAGVGGMLFLKSSELSKEMVFAMECRGFDGEYPVTDRFRFTWKDALFLLLNAAWIALFFYLQTHTA